MAAPGRERLRPTHDDCGLLRSKRHGRLALAGATKQPDGQISKNLSSPSVKINRLTRRANQRYQLAPSHPVRGAGRDRHERG